MYCNRFLRRLRIAMIQHVIRAKKTIQINQNPEIKKNNDEADEQHIGNDVMICIETGGGVGWLKTQMI